MSEYGVTPRGFRPKPFEVIQSQLQESYRRRISPSLSFAPNTIAGLQTGIMAAQLRELWEVAAGVYSSLDADCAEGRALTALSSLTGTVRALKEGDSDLRMRRFKELRTPGLCTLESLRSKLKALPNVRGVWIFNDEQKHCFEVIALGGDDALINKVITQNKPLGIAGKLRRPEMIQLTLDIDLVVKAELHPEETTVMKAMLIDYANEHLTLGESVIVSRFYGPLFRFSKVIDVKISPFTQAIKPNEWVELTEANIHIKSMVDPS